MFLEVLVSCLGGPNKFIFWKADKALIMLIRIFVDGYQSKYFFKMISWITFDLFFGKRNELYLFAAMEDISSPFMSLYTCRGAGRERVITYKVVLII